jgi:hypothetical protein
LTAIILPYRPRPANRMTRWDRHEAQDWVQHARGMGYTHLVFDSIGEDNDPELGDYVLVYGGSQMWYSWGITRCGGKFILWRAADGRTMAVADRMRDVLAAIPPYVGRRLTA